MITRLVDDEDVRRDLRALRHELEDRRRAKLEDQRYPLVPSSRPAVAVVRLRRGHGRERAELDFALRQLRKSLERSGHHATLHRASMTHPRRAWFKRRLAAKRHARAVARRRMMEVRREGL